MSNNETTACTAKQTKAADSRLRLAIASAALAASSVGYAPMTLAQDGVLALEEIVVTARRREERLQDVPISLTVFNQDQLNNANITNAADIATYTPSLHANQRFGGDSTNFAIRGFSQELRTTSSVGVYFAEVVAPRGANTTQSGDGAGPGDLFDLENIQVLKGPQGTLFGRNTTGGAVLLSPKKPTDQLEGYVEGSAGNFDMKKAQGVVNVPVSDVLRVRLGVDTQQRDGYLNNISSVGPDDFADVDYTSIRGSVVWDVTDVVENYTIVKYSESSNNGSPYSLLDCNTTPVNGRPPAYGFLCAPDLANRQATGNDGFYDVANFVPDSKSEMEQAQIINTTTWEVSDSLTVKNILSYAEFESEQNFALYGTDWKLNGLPVMFQTVGSTSAIPTTDQKSFVEEIQLQGTAMEDRLTWQAGLYYEKSEPNGTYGSQNPSTLSCNMSTVTSTNPADWRCNNVIGAIFAQAGINTLPAVPVPGAGAMLVAPGGVEYENQAVYFQGTYELNDQWSVTGGLRYTNDETRGHTTETVYYFPGSVLGGYFAPGVNTTTEVRTPEVSSEEPTWLLGVDYRPMEDLLLYGKYARGYRQGSVNLASVEAWDTHGPEQVDTYEVGGKTAFEGMFPSTLNVALFLNDFQDQQVQFGYLRTNGVGSTSILNAGASTIWGLEAEGTMQLTDSLTLAASYAYLDTQVDELDLPTAPYPAGVYVFSGTSTVENEPLSYSPENKVVLTATYLLPVDPALGDMKVAATYVYTDEMQAVSQATSPYAVLPDYELVNLNLNWDAVAGSAVDASLFVTNLFDEEYITYLTGNWMTGLEAGRTGTPRMYGARVKYSF